MIWKTLGWLCIILAIVGTLLPIMPTVPFLLLAAYCFERSSPDALRWLIEHKILGPPILDWRTRRVIRVRIKIFTGLCISCSLIYTVFFSPVDDWLKITAVIVCSSIVLFVSLQKSQ